MKVDKLYILCIDSERHDLAPIEPSGVALKSRNDKKLGEGVVTLLNLKVKHVPRSMNYTAPLGGEFQEELAALRSSTLTNVGIYIAAHGTEDWGNQVGGLSAAQLAQLIASMKFPAVRKICIESCNMKRVYLRDFCTELYQQSDPKLKPMVAGYTQFVTVVGSSATAGKKVYDVGGESRKLIDVASQEMLGKKVIRADSTSLDTGIYKTSSLILLRSPSNPGTANEKKALSDVKIVAQHDGTTVRWLTLADWGKT